MRHFGLLLGACLALAAPAPRFDAWRVIGPGGGGAIFNPSVSPHDPRTVLVACDMSGSYISHDAGASWRMFNLRERVRFFVFDPIDPHVIYAKAGSLFRSSDDGATWRAVWPRPGNIRNIWLGDDHAEATLDTAVEPRGEITALAVDPNDSKSLYIGVTGDRRTSALWFSSDAGASWQKTADLPGGASRIWIDPHSPKADRTLYIAGANAVAIRQEGRWRTGESPGPLADISAGWPAAGAPVFYAVSREKLFVSEGGIRWRDSALPGFQGKARAVATSLFHPEVAYVSYSGLRNPMTASLGVARTGDGGRHWDLVWQAFRDAGANFHDPWIVARFGAGWPENPRALAVAPGDPDVSYGTDDGRVIRTINAGKTWEGVYSEITPDGGATTNGLDVTTCYGVHFDPFNPKHLLISYTDIGLFASENGGASWHSATREGVPDPWVNTTYWVEFDPKVRGRLWAAMSAIHDLPRPKMWRTRSTDTYDGGVAQSDDGGVSWHVAGQGMPPAATTHVLLDPESPESARTLYATGFGRGVFKSTDGARTWTVRNSGIDGDKPFAWRLARASRSTLYLVVARRSDDGSFGNAADGALYVSHDAADHWSRVALPNGVNGPNGLAVDPSDSGRLYLAAWARSTREGAADGGIFLSTDAGAHWRNVLGQDQHIYDITIDPGDPHLLYAAGFESSAWRSTDRGLTWKRIRGFNFKWGHRVIPDPTDPSRIFVTTFGGSVFHGPAAGDPKAVEDIVP